jgi:hypothetical protein
MNKTWIDDTSGCADCYLAAAGTWTPTDWQPEITEPYIPLANLDMPEWAEPGWLYPPEAMRDNPEGEEVLGFSNYPCNTCGSTLAGDRFALSIWTKEN